MESERFRIAAVQAASVFLDLDATIAKACRLIEEAAAGGATLAVFPEAFVPGYPLWVWFIPPGHTHPLRALYAELHRNAVSIPGPEVARLARGRRPTAASPSPWASTRGTPRPATRRCTTRSSTWARTAGCSESTGSSSPRPASGWSGARAAECDLEVFDLPFGRLSGLLCWENYMPLARYALSAWGEQIHVAPTWDRGEPWISTMRHIAQGGPVLRRRSLPGVPQGRRPRRRSTSRRTYLGDVEGWINPGPQPDRGSRRQDRRRSPGRRGGDPLRGRRRPQLVGPRWQLDIAGHYARPDIFELRVHRGARPFLVHEVRTTEDAEKGTI